MKRCVLSIVLAVMIPVISFAVTCEDVSHKNEAWFEKTDKLVKEAGLANGCTDACFNRYQEDAISFLCGNPNGLNLSELVSNDLSMTDIAAIAKVLGKAELLVEQPEVKFVDNATSRWVIETVKLGTMGPGYDRVTIGKIFDSVFNNGEWFYYESPKGEQVVRFVGEISKYLHDRAIEPDIQRLAERNGMLDGRMLVYSSGYRMFKDSTSSYFAALDAKYGCTGNGIDPKCPDKAKLKLYIDEVIADYLDSYWGVGDAAEFEWVVYPSGKIVPISVASTTWENCVFQNIFDIIYK